MRQRKPQYGLYDGPQFVGGPCPVCERPYRRLRAIRQDQQYQYRTTTLVLHSVPMLQCEVCQEVFFYSEDLDFFDRFFVHQRVRADRQISRKHKTRVFSFESLHVVSDE